MCQPLALVTHSPTQFTPSPHGLLDRSPTHTFRSQPFSRKSFSRKRILASIYLHRKIRGIDRKKEENINLLPSNLHRLHQTWPLPTWLFAERLDQARTRATHAREPRTLRAISTHVVHPAFFCPWTEDWGQRQMSTFARDVLNLAH